MPADIFTDFQIISAETLDYKEGSSVINGNVKVKFGDYTIAAPRAYVKEKTVAGKTSKLIQFVDQVNLSSSDLVLDAASIEIDLAEGLFKCYQTVIGDDSYVAKEQVRSSWNLSASELPSSADAAEKEGAQVFIKSNYQEYNFNSKEAKAHGEVDVRLPGRVITSDTATLQFAKQAAQNQVESISFNGEVVLIEKDKRVEAEELFYAVTTEIIKAYETVKVLFTYSIKDSKATEKPINQDELIEEAAQAQSKPKEDRYLYLFADLLVLEQKEDRLSAFADDFSKLVYIYTEDTAGEARELYVEGISTDPKFAVLTDNASVQYQDKQMSGKEVFMDLENKIIKSLINRPKTRIMQ